MKSGGDPPPAPDPNVSAQAQQRTNIETAIANARLNRVNQQTPWGSINYTEGAKDANGVPSYSSQINLSPQQQALFDQQQQQQTQRGQIGSNLLNQAQGSMSQPLDLSGIHSMYDRYASQQPAHAPQQQQPAQQQADSSQQPDIQQLIAAMEALFQQSAGGSQGGSQYPGGSLVPSRNQALAQALQGPASSQSVAPASPTGAANPSGTGGSSLSYDAYRQRVAPFYQGGQFYNPEATTGQMLNEDQWASMSPQDRYQTIGNGEWLQADPEMQAAFKAKYGELQSPNPGMAAEYGNNLVYGYGEPQMWGQSADQWAKDPSRIMRLPDGRWAMESSNVDGDFLRQAQATDDRLSNQHMTRGTAAILAMAAGTGYFTGAEMGAAGAGGAGAGEAAGTGAFDSGAGTPSLYGGEVGPYAGSPAPVGEVPVSSASPAAPGASSNQSILSRLTPRSGGVLGLSPQQQMIMRMMPALVSLLRGGKK